MRIQTKHKPIILTILLLVFFYISGRSQPGYPDDGFYINLNTDFIDFPDTLHTDWEKAEYLNKNLKIVFIDSTKSIENDSSLIKQCNVNVEIKRKKMYSIDSVNIAYAKIRIDPLYDESIFGRVCYEDKYIIKDLSLSSQSKGTIYWYTGKLIFIYNDIKKEFFLKNIPDGCTLDLKDIKLDKPNEYLELPSLLGKTEIRDIDIQDSMNNKSNYIVEAYRIVTRVISIDETPRQFIRVNILKDSVGLFFTPEAKDYSIIIGDDNFFVTQVHFSQYSSEKGFGGLFATDAFSKFKDEVTVLFCYGMEVLIKIEGIKINDIIEPLDKILFDESAPITDTDFLKSKNVRNGIIREVDILTKWW